MSDIATGRVIFLQTQIETYKKLVEAKDEYIDLLNEELHETASIAANHHWRSSRVEQGEAAREKIEQIKKELE